MGVEEEGTMQVRKKDKKSKKKSKKGEQNEVSDNGIYETERGGKDEVSEGGKSVGAKDGDRGDIEKKKKKRKHKVGEDSGEKSKEDKKDEVSSNGIYETEHGGESEGGKCAEKEDGDKGDIEKKKKKKQKVGEHSGKKAKEDKKNEVSNNGIYASGHDGENEDIEKKKMKKHKVGEHNGEKSKEGKKNEVSNNGIYGSVHDGENKVIEGRNNAEKEDAERVDIEKKKKKKKHRVGENNSDGYREIEKGSDDGKRFELGVGRNDDGNVGEKVERKKIKREKDKNIGSVCHGQDQDCEDAKGGRQSSMDGMYVNEIENGKGNEATGQALDGDIVAKVEKRKERREIVGFGSGDLQHSNCYLATNETQEKKSQGGKLEAFDEDCELDSIEKRKKKRKREKKNENDVSAAIGLGILAEEHVKGNANSTMNEKLDRNMKNGSKGKKKKAKLVENRPEDPKPKKNKKRVSFSGNVEVFPPSDDPNAGMENNEDNLVRGKRFSKEEDEIVKEAVFKYIDAHFLGEEGLKMVLNCKSHPEIKNCWKEITTCLPNRPHSSIYYRAQVLFRRDEKRKWTEEEIEFLQKFQETQGQQNQWKVLADELGKHRFHVKDTWRRIKHKTMKKGLWSQEEYQALFDLVNADLSMKYSQEKKSKHGMLRDNIAWTAISDKLSTRSSANCCLKWYGQLTSDLVDEGVWANADDYRLIDALFRLDASCIEDVDWDNLLDSRPGDVCRKRWKQMVLHIGDNRNKSFADQVEILAKRYCPDLLEAREAWDSKPVVP